MRIKNVKIRKTGNSYVMTVPKAYITDGNIRAGGRYDLDIFEVEGGNSDDNRATS